VRAQMWTVRRHYVSAIDSKSPARVIEFFHRRNAARRWALRGYFAALVVLLLLALLSPRGAAKAAVLGPFFALAFVGAASDAYLRFCRCPRCNGMFSGPTSMWHWDKFKIYSDAYQSCRACGLKDPGEFVPQERTGP
jgi:hypothetical protein